VNTVTSLGFHEASCDPSITLPCRKFTNQTLGMGFELWSDGDFGVRMTLSNGQITAAQANACVPIFRAIGLGDTETNWIKSHMQAANSSPQSQDFDTVWVQLNVDRSGPPTLVIETDPE
jgi:hypothetical protein